MDFSRNGQSPTTPRIHVPSDKDIISRTCKMNTPRFLTIIATMLSISSAINADRIVTTRKHLKPIAVQNHDEPPLPIDTITSTDGLIRFCGYEKTLRATKETLFIENLSDSTITALSLSIEYLDTNGRQIHHRSIKQPVEIPSRQTRRIDIKSWDTQKTYYYVKGERPRKSATPYDIKIKTDTLYIRPCTPSNI